MPPASLAFSTGWSIVVDAYLAAAIDSDHTRRAYRRHLTQAFAILGVETVADVHGAHLAAYRAAVATSSRSPAYQGQTLAALRAFLTWSRTMGAHTLPGELVKVALRTPTATVRRPYQVLAEPEVAAILVAAGTPRDRELLGVLLGGGLRVAEAVGLDVADVLTDQDGGTALYTRQGKGRKDRTVPIQPEVAKLLRTYLDATGRRLGDLGPLFRAHDRAASKLPRGRLTTRAVASIVERCAEAAEIHAKAVSPHTMRHTYAIRSLRAGGNVVAVSKLLGHASITTTQRYVDHLAVAELRNAVPALPVPE
jgi:site-specific recombinase XerD